MSKTPEVPGWDRVKQIFQRVLDQPEPERATVLAQSCGDDAALRAEIEALLAAHDAAGSFCERPAIDLPSTEPPSSALGSGARLGPYTIVAHVASGGMGEVYRATDTRLGRTVAIKVLSPRHARHREMRARFDREAHAVARLNHPNICTLLDVGHVDDCDFLVFEYVEGETLAERLAQGALPFPDLVRTAEDVLSALDHAHRHGVVHRDLKPSNILLTPGGTKLCDFGLAMFKKETPETETALTTRHEIIGTLQYMSPEQLEGHEADERSDIFSLGAVLYEMATGDKAFAASSEARLIAAVLTLQPPPVVERRPLSPPLLDRTIQRCLAKDPDERWQNARDLLAVVRSLQEVDIAAPTRNPARPFLFRRALRTLGLATAIFGSGVVVAYDPPPAPVHRSLVRFFVRPPENAYFVPTSTTIPGPQFAMSPDGRYLAFVAAPVGGRPLLWLRELDSGVSRPLPGTADALYPFWSPNSQSLGFFAERSLKRIDLQDGRVQVLAPAADGRGGSWSKDGVILFSPNSTAPLFRLPARGGTAVQATAVDRARHEKGHRWPCFLPDGRHFIFFINSDQGEVAGDYLGSLADMSIRLIDQSRYHAIYVDPGVLLYIANGPTGRTAENDLVARPFSASTFSFSGDPVTLVSGVGGASNGYGAFSASFTGILAHAGVFDPNRELAWLSRTGTDIVRAHGPADYIDFRLARNDDRVAIAKTRGDTQTSDLFLMDLHEVESQLTSNPASDASPVWSPDGTKLVFRSKRGATAANDLYELSVGSPGSERLLLSTPLPKYPTDWSPDGAVIVYHTLNARGDWDVCMLSAGEDPLPTCPLSTPANESQARISANGRWMAYTSDGSGRPEVMVQTFPPDGREWRVSTGGGTQPQWTRNGRELLFLALDGTLMAAELERGSQFGIRSIRPERKLPVSPFEQPFSPTFGVSADGTRLLVNVPSENTTKFNIFVTANWTELLDAQR